MQFEAGVRDLTIRNGARALLFLLASTTGTAINLPDAAETNALVSAEQVRQLSQEQAAGRHPVKITGTVTAQTDDGFYLQQNGTGIFVSEVAIRRSISPGEHIALTGVTASGSYAPSIVASRVEFLGLRPWPAARRASLEQMLAGEQDAAWVEVNGILRDVDLQRPSADAISLVMNENGREFRIAVTGMTRARAESLIGSDISVQGVCRSLVSSRGQFIGFTILTPAPSLVRVRSAPAQDVWESQPMAIDSLLRFTGRAMPRQRIRVQGIVTLHRWPASLFLQSGEHGVYVQTPSRETFYPGDKVDVAGFVSPGDYTPILQYASVRKMSVANAPPPQAVTAQEAFSGDYDARLVQVEGTLIDVRTSGGEATLTMRADGRTFDAYLRPLAAGAEGVLSIPLGSYIRVLGVCSVKVNEDRVPRTFRIAMRSAADFSVVKHPAWSQERIFMVVAGVGLLALLAGTWVFFLRKRVREQTRVLQYQLNEIEMLYRTAPVGLCFVDENLRFVRINEQLAGYNGRPAREHIGKTIGEMIPNLAPLVEPLYRQVIASAKPIVKLELRGEPRNGHAERVWSISFYPVTDRDVCGVSTVVQDITDVKLAQSHLLEQANDLAVSNAELQNFAYMASHDLQEPLRIVTIYSQLLSSKCADGLTSDSVEYLSFIRDAANRMHALIRDLLIYSRLSTEEDADVRKVPISTAFESAVKNMEALIRDSGATVECDALPAVYIQHTQLLQVFQNLFANAIAYRSEERPHIRVTAQHADGRWIFSVKDNGIGIDARYHNRIFGVFKRLNRETPGTGIGLAICKRIVEKQGGRIWVESAQGQGSTFHFSLPASVALSAAS